jgi:hypothetical protein
MAKFYVYTLSYPQDMGGDVFYVGKGSGKRLYNYFASGSSSPNGANWELCDIFKSIHAANLIPIGAKVFETDDEQEAYDKEYELMLEYGSQLVNRRIERTIVKPPSAVHTRQAAGVSLGL